MKLFLTINLFFVFCCSALSGAEWLPSIEVVASGQSPIVKLDPKGNGVAIWLSADSKSIISGVLPVGAPAWESFPLFSLGFPGTINTLNLSVDDAGDAVAVWAENTIEGKFVLYSSLPFGSRTWSTPVFIAPTIPNETPSNPSMGTDANGNAVIVWQSLTATSQNVIEAALVPFGSTMMPTPQVISTTQPQNFVPDVSVNASGDAIAVWRGENALLDYTVDAAVLTGGVWGPSQDLTAFSPTTTQMPTAAIDQAGNGVAIWYSGATTIFGAAYVSGSWHPTTTVATTSDPTPFIQLGVDSSGNALATWLNTASIQSATLPFNTPTWVNLQNVPNSGSAGPGSLTVDQSGVATLTWVNTATKQMEASMLQGLDSTPWGTPSPLSTTATAGQVTTVAADGFGEFITVWQETTGSLRSSFFAPFPVPPSPLNVTGARFSNQFLLQKELSIRLAWSPFPPGVDVVVYKIYSDSELTNLVGEVSANTSPLTFVIHNVRSGPPQTFYIVSVNSFGFPSPAVVITV